MAYIWFGKGHRQVRVSIINKTMSFAISITSPDTTDAADHSTNGGSASEPIMLRNVDIMSPLLSWTWNQSLNCSWELSGSKYVLHTEKMKRTEHQQSDFQKQRVSKANPTIKFFGKSSQLIKICTTLRWQLSIQDKVLCRELATKRVEDDGDKQSSCSQVLMRQMSQLANATSGDSVQLMKSVASASCCIYFSNLRQNSSTLDFEIGIYVSPCDARWFN